MNALEREEWIAKILQGLPQLLHLKEAAAVLRCSTRSVRRRVEDGRLRALRTAEGGSGRILIPRTELLKLLVEMAAD